MTKLPKVILFLVLAAVICLPGIGSADFIIVGGPEETGSWRQGFEVKSNQSFNTINVYGTGSGVNLEGQGVSVNNWNPKGAYTQSNVTISGPDTKSAFGHITFIDNQDHDQSFEFHTYYGDDKGNHKNDEWYQLSWKDHHDGHGYHWDVEQCQHSAVPIPAAGWLLGSGLLGLLAIRRKMS